MADPQFDFPANPTAFQIWTAPTGTVYVFDGTAWQIGFYDSDTQAFGSIGAMLQQVRVLLQDVDNTSGQYRYSTESLLMAVNQGLLEMFRIRPDLFLELSFNVPQYSMGELSAVVPVEQQFVPSLIFYTVGLAQLRDDEQNQDARAIAFTQQFVKSMTSVT